MEPTQAPSQLISIVVPALDEVESLAQLASELGTIAESHQLAIEVLFVDDGSRDGSWHVIQQLAVDPRMHGIRLRRNFGKAAALAAGFDAAAGQIVFQMDADLQDNPAEIPKLLSKLDMGFDVVNGWKRKRVDPWHKVWPSRMFNWLVSWLTGLHLHDHNCGLKCFRSAVIKEIALYGELHRFIPVIAHSRGYRVTEMEVQHRPRRFGRSKYGMRRFYKGFLDLMTVKFLAGFGQRPQHLLGGFGLVAFLLGAAGLVYLTVLWVIDNWVVDNPDKKPIHERALLPYSIAAVLLGFQMLAMGLLAELIIAMNIRNAHSYSIAERTEPIANRRSQVAD